MEQFQAGFEGCTDPGDLGWKHGHEDIGGPFTYRPDCALTADQLAEYKDQYEAARQGWD